MSAVRNYFALQGATIGDIYAWEASNKMQCSARHPRRGYGTPEQQVSRTSLALLDIHASSAAVCDGIVIVGVAILTHLFVNVNLTPKGTEETNECALWKPSLFSMYALSTLAAAISTLTRTWTLKKWGRHHRFTADGAYTEVLWILFIVEFTLACITVPTGFYMLTSLKPAGWKVALHRNGCDVFSSPPALLGWVVGEALAVGSGFRVSLALVAYVYEAHGQCAVLFSILSLALIGVATTIASIFLVGPWFETLS